MKCNSRTMIQSFTRQALERQRSIKWRVTRLGIYLTGYYTLFALWLESREWLWDTLYLADGILFLLILTWLPYMVSVFRYMNGTYGTTSFEVAYIDNAIRTWQEEQGIALPRDKQREQNVERIRERLAVGHYISVPDSG